MTAAIAEMFDGLNVIRHIDAAQQQGQIDTAHLFASGNFLIAQASLAPRRW
jgi:hypothetical protein